MGAAWHTESPAFCPHTKCGSLSCAQDAYGNYVIQSALSVTTGPLHNYVVDCIRPYLPSLRGTPHGKRILQRVGAKA